MQTRRRLWSPVLERRRTPSDDHETRSRVGLHRYHNPRRTRNFLPTGYRVGIRAGVPRSTKSGNRGESTHAFSSRAPIPNEEAAQLMRHTLSNSPQSFRSSEISRVLPAFRSAHALIAGIRSRMFGDFQHSFLAMRPLEPTKKLCPRVFNATVTTKLRLELRASPQQSKPAEFRTCGVRKPVKQHTFYCSVLVASATNSAFRMLSEANPMSRS